MPPDLHSPMIPATDTERTAVRTVPNSTSKQVGHCAECVRLKAFGCLPPDGGLAIESLTGVLSAWYDVNGRTPGCANGFHRDTTISALFPDGRDAEFRNALAAMGIRTAGALADHCRAREYAGLRELRETLVSHGADLSRANARMKQAGFGFSF